MVRVNITGLAPPTKKSVKKNSLFRRWKTATRFGSSQKQLMNNLMIFAFIYLQYTLYTNSIQNQKPLQYIILIHFGSEMLYLPSLSLLVTTTKHKSPEKPSTWMRKGHSSAWQPGETLTIRWLSTTHPPKIIIYSKGGLSFNTIHISKYSNRLHDNSLDLASAGCITKLCCWCRIKS